MVSTITAILAFLLAFYGAAAHEPHEAEHVPHAATTDTYPVWCEVADNEPDGTWIEAEDEWADGVLGRCVSELVNVPDGADEFTYPFDCGWINEEQVWVLDGTQWADGVPGKCVSDEE